MQGGFERLKLKVVKTALASSLKPPDLLTRLVDVLDEADQCGVICKLLELDGGVFRCTVIGVEGEGQWGENKALRSSSADGCRMIIYPASLAAACLSGGW